MMMVMMMIFISNTINSVSVFHLRALGRMEWKKVSIIKQRCCCGENLSPWSQVTHGKQIATYIIPLPKEAMFNTWWNSSMMIQDDNNNQPPQLGT